MPAKPLSSTPGPGKWIFPGVVLGLLVTLFWLTRLDQLGNEVFLSSGLYLLSFALLGLLIRYFPATASSAAQYGLILALAVLARLLFFYFPASTDVNRYIWEGYISNRGLNPYVLAPSDPALHPFISDIWHNINHKDASACYPPLAMLLFKAAAVSPGFGMFKSLVIAFDFGTVLILAAMTRLLGLPPSRLLLYALNPLVLVFLAGEGHLDSIQIFFICLSLYWFERQWDRRAFLALGCAVMSKYLAVILLPFVIRRENLIKSLYMLPPLLLFLAFPNTGLHFFSSLIPFGAVMHYNDSITVILRVLAGSYATPISLVLLVMGLGIIFLTVHDRLRACYLACATLLLLLGTLHPWYLTLITPFMVFFPSPAWLFLHMAVVFTFPVLSVQYRTGVFQEIHWLKLFEYLPFYGLLLAEPFRSRRWLAGREFAPIEDVSVIIPTLNEADQIPRILRSLKHESQVSEIIVVDANSSDGTDTLARELGARVIAGERGRGYQIAKGIEQSRGDLILVLHADCVPERGITAAIIQRLNRSPTAVGGSLGMRYQSSSWKHHLLAALNNVRGCWCGIAFGDQGQFVRRDALERIGGYPEQMLMEDVELSFRLKENGEVVYIPRGIEVSGRRWNQLGFLSNGFKVIRLSLTYMLQRRLGCELFPDQVYYRKYYSNPKDETT